MHGVRGQTGLDNVGSGFLKFFLVLGNQPKPPKIYYTGNKYIFFMYTASPNSCTSEIQMLNMSTLLKDLWNNVKTAILRLARCICDSKDG